LKTHNFNFHNVIKISAILLFRAHQVSSKYI